MIDNITLAMNFKPPDELLEGNNMPFVYSGITYYPEYANDIIYRYCARLKNLVLYLYHDKIVLRNSLHKYWNGHNYGDFTLTELKSAIESLNDEMGVNWKDARLKKIEYR